MADTDTGVPDEYKDHVAPNKDWQDIVAWVGDLPPLPHVASRAIGLLEDPNVTSGDLTELMSSDPALAARVLKIANSAMFARQRQITTLNQAIMVIGFKTLKGIVVAATLRQMNRKYGDFERVIWENSLATGMASLTICNMLKKRFGDELFLLGLLHDLGKVVLVNHAPNDYKQVIELTKAGTLFFEAEEQVLGFSHPLIGALVAKKWNFSPQTCQVILHHHDPITTPIQGEQEEKTVIVQAGNYVAHCLGLGHFDGYPDLQEPAHECLFLLGLDDAGIEKLLNDVRLLYTEQSSAFN